MSSSTTDSALADLMKNLSVSKGADLAKFVNEAANLEAASSTFDALQKQLQNKKDAAARENALIATQKIAELSPVSEYVVPYFVVILPSVLASAGDKIAGVKTAAAAAASAIVKAINPNAIQAILPALIESLTKSQKFPERLLALDLIDDITNNAPSQGQQLVPELIPAVSEAMWVTKKEVSTRAYKTMVKVCELINNKDITDVIPALIECIAKPENVPKTVHVLGATTLVSKVEEPTLAIMVPLLDRGLTERETAIKRKAAVIVDNMAKLVEDPNVVAPFLPQMQPKLEKNFETLADPEARAKTKQALDTLNRVGNVKDGKIPEVRRPGDIKTIVPILESTLGSSDAAKFATIKEYISAIAGQLVISNEIEQSAWSANLKSLVAVIVGDKAETVVDALRRKASNAAEDEEVEPDEEEGEDLCNCRFNLSYTAKTLLMDAKLRLKRGQRYGLCGPNGSGKSTLMREINQEKVDGFPKRSEVKTVFVEHDLDAADTEMTTIGWTMMKLAQAKVDVSEPEVETQLNDFGFSPDMVSGAIAALSGGWKMKLALCRAVLEKPDILLLDEPTNHLDHQNVAWLENFLVTSPCTSIIVSHDSAFMDNVCQHIIHYERFKLRRYRGNLKEFVSRVPSAKSYYDLSASEMEFAFPNPGPLEKVNTKAKAILRATDISFQYPGSKQPQLSGITFQCSLGSRIAVVGPNGAGKSTLVNVLTGELVPDSGELYVHENMRIAYIKQHAFQHIDDHLDKTASEYIQWRFETGEDRETMDRADKVVTEADEKAMDKIFNINGSQRRIIAINSRRKFKNTYEYDCSFALGSNIGQKNESWTPMMTADNEHIPRSELMASHAKMLARVDLEEAKNSGQFRPLVRKEIEAHGAQFGLDDELISHTHLKSLSGGQRVKVVLSACSWQRPHLIVLDEPTNYLDRDSLGALSKALKKFEGGVIIISHAKEFTENLTDEIWAVQAGKMTPTGHNWISGQGSGPRLATDAAAGPGTDALGNKLEDVVKKKLTSKELRKKRQERMKRRKAGEEVFSDEE